MPSASPLAASHETFERLLGEIGRADPSVSSSRLRHAFSYAGRLYGDGTHWTGAGLLEHALQVLAVFLSFEPNEDAIIGCLLQHALTTKNYSLETLEEEFGPSVRGIVGGVHLLAHVTTRSKRMTIDHLRQIFLRVSDDPRVVLIVLCAQRALLDHLARLTPEEARRAARDVLRLYAPVAARLGIYTLKHQLERIAFPVVYPVDSARIVEQMQEIHGRYGDFLENASESLMRYLRQEGVYARVELREKQAYSIFLKMREKSVTHVEDLYDLFALRVIVSTDLECYQVLGLLHRIGHPIANRFKDFIAFPKPNGYQSLHTTLAHLPGSPDWVFVEVQVRTEAMHREAEYGIAAHWSYKEGGTAEQAARRAQLQSALSQQSPEAAAGRLTDHIFVLTPRGDIVELPEGATPLDFAFQLHTDLGIAFRAARVNGAIAPLTHQLENGDIVEVLRHRDPRPSPRWLTLLKTASAKSRLKRFLANQDRPQLIDRGRKLFNAELAAQGLAPLDPDLSVLRSIDRQACDVEEREDLLVKLAQGSLRAPGLLSRVDALRETAARVTVRNVRAQSRKTGDVAPLSGIPMPIRHAKCCKPDTDPGCPIAGIIGRGGEVRVHRTSCKMIRNANEERKVAVRWL